MVCSRKLTVPMTKQGEAHIGHELEGQHCVGVIPGDREDVHVIAAHVLEGAGAQNTNRRGCARAFSLLGIEDVCSESGAQVAPAVCEQSLPAELQLVRSSRQCGGAYGNIRLKADPQ